MKRFISLLLIGVALMSIPLAGAWATWEGNAGIASASDFPGSGMYVKSDMFPRNTIVEIQNLETESTVRAVVTGASGVPGLVAVLSPDTAAALNIRSGSVCRVRIRIPTPVNEVPAEGTVEGISSADPDVNPAAAVAARGTVDPVVPLSSIATATETAVVPVAELAPAVPAVPVDPAMSDAETLAETATPAEPAEPVTPVESVAAVEPVEPIASAETVAPVEPAIPTETEMVLPVEGESAIASETEVPVTEESAPVSETAVTAEVGEAAAEPEDSGFVGEEPVITAEEAVPAETAPVEVAAAPEVPVPEETSPTYYEEPSVMETETTLVPTDLNPPVLSATEVAPSAMAGPSIVVSPVESPVESPAIPIEPASSSIGRADITLPFVDTLAKGKYYVQIASYLDAVNARRDLDAYGSKYPMVVKKAMVKGKEYIEVLIGPVKKDEYGAVIERFHSLGFKQAYARKGK